MKKILSLFLALSIVAGLYSVVGYSALAQGALENDSDIVTSEPDSNTVIHGEHTFVDGVCTHCGLQGGICGDNLAWLFDEASGALTIEGDGAMYDLDYENGQESPWARYCRQIRTISLPEGLTSIGDFAFDFCEGVEAIDIPSTVQRIGRNAFRYCSNMKSLHIPAAVVEIGQRAFMGCGALETITVESGNTVYHSAGNCLIHTENGTLVKGCNNSVVPNDGSITSIGETAFMECERLTSVLIPEGLTDIGFEAFAGCVALSSVSLPSTIQYLGEGAFNYCIRLEEISLNEGLRTLNNYVFSSCSSLTEITLPQSLESIGEYAFHSCSSLKQIVIPSGVIGVGCSPFGYCTELESITVESGNEYYYSSNNCLINTQTKSIIAGCKTSVIPNDGSVTSISNEAFAGCRDLTTLRIPAWIDSMGSWIFDGCENLSLTVKVDSCAHRYAVRNNIPYVTEGTVVSIELISAPDKLVYPINGSLRLNGLVVKATYDDGSTANVAEACVIGECDMSSVGVKTVEGSYGKYTFSFEITVDADLVEFPESEHPYADNLQESWHYTHKNDAEGLRVTFSQETETESGCDWIYILDSNGLEIGRYSGTELAGRTIEIPGNSFEIRLETDGSLNAYGFKVTNIEVIEHCEHNYVDFTCTVCGRTLVNGTCGNDVIWTFDEFLGEMIISGTGDMYNLNENGNPWEGYKDKIKTVTISDGVTSVSDDAFFGCHNLKSVNIAASVGSIGQNPFKNCKNLESLTVAEGNQSYHSSGNCIIKTQEKRLISGCKNSIIPNDGSVEIIGSEAFSDCTGLASIEIPEGITTIDSYAFRNCYGLTSVTLPDTLICINDGAFLNCENLSSIEIPAATNYISGYAFENCGLDNITVAQGNTVYSSSGNCLIDIERKTLINGTNNTVIPTDGSVEAIGGNAFYGCVEMTAITIPQSVSSIEHRAFIKCESLESITVAEGNPAYHSSGNCLVETESKTLVAGCKNSVIPTDGSVEIIGEWAFDGAKGLSSIEIPQSVLKIGNSSFAFCENLRSVTIAASVTSIGEWAFDGCYDFVLHVKSGSYAENYAIERGYTYEATGSIVSVEITALPDKIIYPIGGTLKTNGLVVMGIYDDGSTADITASCVISDCDMSTAGEKTVNVVYGDFICSFAITVDPDLVLYPESDHPYQSNMDETWYYTHKTPAEQLAITFSDDTHTEHNYDIVYIYNADGSSAGQYSGNELSGKTVIVVGNSFSIRFVTDGGIEENGFTVVNVEEYTPCNHELLNFVCTKCGKGFTGSQCGENLTWALDDETYDFAISGTGEMYNFDPDAPWEWCRDRVQNVVIADGVTNISSRAFLNCNNLKSVKIPQSVTSIGTDAFWNGMGELLLIVAEGSFAHTYAQENGINFEFLPAECNHKNTVSINASSHSCQWHGYTGDTFCVDCCAVLTRGEIIPADHNYEFFNRIEPTCGNTGYEIYKCIACNEITVTPIAATGHSLVFSHRIDATYGAPAVNVFVCEHCGNEVYKEFGFALCDFNKDGMLNDADFDALGTSPDFEEFDFNQNGEADDFDIMVIKHLINGTELEKIADVNGDGTSNLKDVVRAKKILAGYDVEGDIDRNLDGSPDAKDLIFISDFVLCLLFGNR